MTGDKIELMSEEEGAKLVTTKVKGKTIEFPFWSLTDVFLRGDMLIWCLSDLDRTMVAATEFRIRQYDLKKKEPLKEIVVKLDAKENIRKSYLFVCKDYTKAIINGFSDAKKVSKRYEVDLKNFSAKKLTEADNFEDYKIVDVPNTLTYQKKTRSPPDKKHVIILSTNPHYSLDRKVEISVVGKDGKLTKHNQIKLPPNL